MPFDTLTKDDALKEVKPLTPAEQATLDFIAGDHWQDGRAWVGPPDTDAENRTQTLKQKIKPVFVSKNIVKEVIEAHRDAIIGQEPDWSAATREALKEGEEASPQVKALMEEAELLATEWWDMREAIMAIQDAAANAVAVGRGFLRFVVPPAYLSDDGVPLQGDIKTWLKRIYLRSVPVAAAVMLSDEETLQEASVIVLEKDKEKHVELCFLDDDEKTIIRRWEGEKESTDTSPLDLGGNLLVFELTRSPLISEQIRQNQALFNTTLTMRTRNVGVGGFPQQTFIGVERPSHIENGEVVYDNFKQGAGVTNFAAPQTVEGPDGTLRAVTTPSVSYRDPVKVDTFEQTEKAAYQNILEEARQLHRLIARDATASGESRVQARADFITSLRDTKTQVDAAGRWVLETVLALAAALSDSPAYFSALRFRFESNIDTGPLSPDERRIIREEAQGDKPLRSVQSAMAEIGIEDPAAMLEEIVSERELLIDPAAKAEAVRAKGDLLSEDQQLRELGYDDQQISSIRRERASVDVIPPVAQ